MRNLNIDVQVRDQEVGDLEKDLKAKEKELKEMQRRMKVEQEIQREIANEKNKKYNAAITQILSNNTAINHNNNSSTMWKRPDWGRNYTWRKMKLSEIKYSQANCAPKFRDGREIATLMNHLREYGYEKILKDPGNAIEVVRFGKCNFALSNRRFMACKNVYF